VGHLALKFSSQKGMDFCGEESVTVAVTREAVGLIRDPAPLAMLPRQWPPLANLRKRFEEFSLSFNPDKTRLIEFGRFAADRRAQRGLGKPETFNFLGFTFISTAVGSSS
jgi:hypothetical protein